ncbi:MAG: Fur family transcriptional regulator, partial [Thermomicrobiales bacterium]
MQRYDTRLGCIIGRDTISFMTTQDVPTTTTETAGSPISREEIEKVLGQHGYRLTTPRRTVIDTLLRYRRPFTAEQLVADVRDLDLGQIIGRATVYRTLEILAAIDVLKRIIQADGHPAYICDTVGHRHHLVCSSCGKAVAFTACPIDELVRS